MNLKSKRALRPRRFGDGRAISKMPYSVKLYEDQERRLDELAQTRAVNIQTFIRSAVDLALAQPTTQQPAQ